MTRPGLLARLFRSAAPAPAPPGPDDELDLVLDAIDEPVLVIADGVVEIANAAARALLGAHIVGEDARVAVRHPLAAEQLLAAGDGPPIELVGLGGREGRWTMRIGRIADGRRVVRLADEGAAHAAERMRVDFVANASHELRTPLAAIIGYAETLRTLGEGEPATRARFLGIVEAEARRMRRLVEDLLSLSRIEGTKHRAPDEAVELAALIRSVADEVARDPTDVALDLPDAPALANGDRAQLAQLLHNLIGNALAHGRAPASVRLAPAPDARWLVEVGDSGPGVAPEHLPRLTERFYRVDAGRSRAGGGTGLGLAIVKHIVERHRGRLSIASAPGRGVTVSVLLPAATLPASAPVSQKGNGIAAWEAVESEGAEQP